MLIFLTLYLCLCQKELLVFQYLIPTKKITFEKKKCILIARRVLYYYLHFLVKTC